MHTIHHTRAFVVKSIEHGEASRRVWLFTREFGLVVATAQGVRKQGAKLQMQLVEYTLIDADLVKGREVWRLVSVDLVVNPLSERRQSPFARGYVRTLTLLGRFLVGEDPHPELFAHLVVVAEYIANHADGDVRAFDTLSLWRALVLLGYIAIGKNDSTYMTESFAGALEKMDEMTTKRFIVQSNTAITESQL